MSLRPKKKSCVAVSILGVYTHYSGVAFRKFHNSQVLRVGLFSLLGGNFKLVLRCNIKKKLIHRVNGGEYFWMYF